jgi:hypothetical protein
MTAPLKLAIAAAQQQSVLRGRTTIDVAFVHRCWLEGMIAEYCETLRGSWTPLVCTSGATTALSLQKLRYVVM